MYQILETLLYLAFGLREDVRKIMSQLDTLNAGIAALQTDENSEDTELTALETLGAQLQASITQLQASVNSGSAPTDLTGAIAAISALKTQNDARLAKMQADLAAGTTYEGTLPQPTPQTPTPVTDVKPSA